MRPTTRLLVLLAAAALGACVDRSEPHAHEAGRQPFRPPELGDRGRPVLSFVNGDFEGGGTTGWTVSTYLNQGLRVSSPTVRTDLQLQTGGVDRTSVKTAPTESLLASGVAAGATLFVPKYHTHAVVVNELGDTNNVNGIKQSMVVTNEDVDPNDNKVHVRFALAAVLENPGHTARQQPYFWATLTNVSRGNAVLFYTFNYANQPGVAWKSTTDPLDGDPVLYTDWQSVDIAPGAGQLAVGDTVELEIIAAGCSLGGHYGHVYLDGIGAYLPGLGVTATAPASANRNTAFTYTYRYSNNGIDPAPNTVITVPLPTGTTFSALSAPGASCTAPAAGATGTVTCNVGTLNPATSATFTVTVNATGAVGSTISHGNYTIAATQVSPLTGPLVTTAVTSGVTYADLVTTATDGVAALGWGATTSYTVTVRNAGPSAANGATIAVPVPANVSAFTGWTCTATGGAACGAASGSGALATTANLPAGGQVSYAIAATVTGGSGASTISLQATAAPPATVTDNVASNNVAVDLDSLGTLRTLTLTKSGGGAGTVLSSPAAISCGAACGSQSAAFLDGTSVVLTASTAAGQRFISWTAGPCAGSTAPTCTATLTADTTFTAAFVAGDWLVSGSAPGGNGTISCQSPRLDGQPASCVISAAARHRLTALTDNGASVIGAIAAGSYTIAAVTADHDVVATFDANTAATSLGALPASPSTLGQPVTFTATAAGVAPSGTPGGTVDFFEGATPLCVGVALSAGAAGCTTSALPVGSHLVTAVTSGDLTWPGASSTALAYTVGQGSATLALAAAPSTPSYGQPVTLTATATGPAGAATPGGTVTFRADGVAIPGCSDVPLVGGAATCVTTALPAGSPAVTLDYGGDASYLPAAAAASLGLAVDKAPATVTLGALAQTYDGAANPVTVATSPGGLAVVVTYGGSTTPPTAPGTYAVIATVVDPNYQGSATGTLVVAKADAGLVLGGLAQTYSGGPLAATATTSPPGLGVSFTYDGGPIPPTAPGTYAVVATINDANYQGTASGTLVIAKAAATVTLGSLSQSYDGAARVATATTTPAGLAVAFTYDGSATPPVNAGSYTVVGTVQDPNYTGTFTATLVVAKAAATITLGSLAQTYDGTARSATATTSPAGLAVTFTYDGGAAAPVNAASYAVVGTVVDANYTGSASGALVIAKATATVTLGSLAQTYTGTARAATATTSPAGLAVTFTYDGGATPPVNAGSYTVVGTINDANHQGSASGTLVIAKAAATVAGTAGSLAQTYDGTARVATATTSPAGLTVTFTYDGSATPPVNAGSYTVVGTIQDPNYAGTFTATLVVAKAAATVTLGSLSQTYDGTARVATATTSPSGLAVTFTYDGGAAAPVNAASYAVVGTVVDANYTGSASGALVIAKATATVTLGSLAQTYTGTARAATATTSPAGLAVTFTYDGGATPPVNAGSYTVVGTINDANHQGSASGTLVIAKAAATVTLGTLAQTYTGAARSATATTSPAGLAVTLTYDGGAAAPVDTGSYAVVGTIIDTNYTGSASGTLVVAKAAATVLLGGLSQPYTGAARPVSATTLPPGLTVTVTYAGSAAPPSDVGSYAVVATIDDANYQGTTTDLLEITRGASAVGLTSSANPSVYLQPVVLTATVTGGAATPTGSVTFTDGVTTLCGSARPLSGGVATCTTSALSVGSHAVTASYSGDATYDVASGGLTQVVDVAATATALSASTPAPVYGQAMTLTATVSVVAPGGGTPAGTVAFAEGTTTFCPAAPVSGGVATCLLPATLPAGPHAFTATYGGGAQHAGSASPGLARTVARAAAAVVVATTGSPSTYGSPVTFTATVSGPAGPPGGLVTFTDGPRQLCADVTLDAGVARCTTSALTFGNHLVTAAYAGDANHAAASAFVPQFVDPAAPAVAASASPSPATFGDAVTLAATVTGVATGAVPGGTVTFTVAGTTLCSAGLDAGGVARCTSIALAAADHPVTAQYLGDGNYQAASAGFTLTVTRAPVTVSLTSSANPASYGAPLTLTADVAGPGGTPGGAVTFRDGTTVLCGGTRPLDAGRATCTLAGAAGLGGGAHTLTATYEGAGNYQGGSSAPLELTVARATPVLALATAPNPSTFGGSVTFTATLAGAGLLPGGEVTFTAGALALCGPVTASGGVASCSSSALRQGVATITASYAGDANYEAGTATQSQTVRQATAVTTLTADPSPSVFGQDVALTARVGGVAGAAVPATGQVTIIDGGTLLCGGALDLVNGAATCHLSDLAAADHELVAIYSGDANYAAGGPGGVRHTVRRAATEVALAVSPAAAVHGEPLVFTATVTAVAPGAGRPSGPVDFYDGAVTIGTALLDPATGEATFTLLAGQALPAGDHVFMATYGGDGSFEGSASPPLPAYTIGQATSLVTVTPSHTPSVFGEAVTFTVEVLPVAPGGGTPGGTVSVTVGGGAPFDLPLSGGSATFTTAALDVGSHAIDASYPGDGNFLPSAGHHDQVVIPTGSAVAGVADLEPSVYGQRITVTATVAATGLGAGTASGQVRLLRDGTPIDTALLDASGTARLGVATLPVGRTTLTLEYVGDGRFLASQSALEHLVLPAFTDVTLDASSLLPVYGEPVTLSATVTPAFFGVGAPTGMVAFLDGATVLQVEPLDAFGRAAFTATSLAPGGHLLKAVYQGDGNFLDNESVPAQLLVRPASIHVGLAVGPNPSLFSEPVTWSVQALALEPSLATPAGLVDVLEGSTVLATLSLDGAGHASGAAPAFEVGAHTLTARYRDGDQFVALGTASVTQQVVQAPTTVAVTSTPSPSTFGALVTLRAHVATLAPATVAPTGQVAFLVGGLPVGTVALDGAGDASIDVPGLATGLHQVVASYQGDGHAEPRDSAPLPHLVVPADTTTSVVASPAAAVFGQAVLFTAIVTSSAGTPSGQVAFLEGGVTLGSATLDPAGQAAFTTSALPVGGHAVTASYLGDGDHRASTSPAATAQVTQAATATRLDASRATAVTGQPVRLTATVTPQAPGAGTPGGQVTFRDGLADLGTAPVDPATRTATLVVTTLAVGPHALTAAYPGDVRFAGSSSAPALTLQIDKADVTVVVTTDPAGSALGQPVTVSVTVSASDPGAGTPSGDVALADGAAALGTITLAGGSGSRSVTLPAGPHTLAASYAGDAGFRPGRGEQQHVVARASSTTALATSGSPSIFGQPVTLTATVSPGVSGFGEPGGTVTFKDGAAVLGTAPVGPGAVAALTTALAGGRRDLAAEYGGDSSFAPSRGTATQDVQQAAVAIAVTASPAPAQFGQPVTLTITLTSPTPGAGVPDGTVTVHDGLALVGTVPLAGGVATLTLDALVLGPHPLTVGYAGTPAFQAASKSIAVQVDEAAVRLRLASSRHPSRAGRPVTFTATAETDGAAPTGSVTFKDGNTPIGSAPLVDGVATLTTRTLRKGTHPISAQLAAGGGFGAATATLAGGQVVENSPPVAGSGSALRLGPAGAALAEGTAGGRLDGADGTVELWARAGWTSPDQVGAAPTLARLGDATAARWAVGVTPARDGLTVTLGTATPTAVPADLRDGAWHQVALVSVGGAVTVLLDGVEVGAVDGGFADVVGQRLTVGEGFVGEIDELRLWSTARTAAALTADARRPLRGDEDGLRSCWRMDEPDVGELFDAGPAALDLTAQPSPGLLATDTHVASNAWRHRAAWRERSLEPIDAGYDADGDRLRLAVTAPPAHGTASTDPVALQVGYLGEAGYTGADQLTFRLTDEDDATGDFTVELAVARILACRTDADCSGGDLCAQSTCVAPAELAARAGGCGCTSGGGGALALWSLLALGLTARRRPRRPEPRDGRRP